MTASMTEPFRISAGKRGDVGKGINCHVGLFPKLNMSNLQNGAGMITGPFFLKKRKVDIEKRMYKKAQNKPDFTLSYE